MKFDSRYFTKFKFTKEQIKQNFKNAQKDLGIAKKDKIPEVRFNYSYTSLIKVGISLLSFYGVKVKSVRGHHVKLIEELSGILKDDAIAAMGNVMRSKRNLDFYAGGIEVTEKECRDYIKFVENVVQRVKKIIPKEVSL